MKIVVHNHYSESDEVFDGEPKRLYHRIVDHYPWLAHHDVEDAGDLEALLEQLDSSQGFSVDIVEGAPTQGLSKSESAAGNLRGDAPEEASEAAVDMLGFNPTIHPAFGAARFLSGRSEVDLQTIRKALYQHEDYVDAALAAYGLEVSDTGRRSLKTVISMGDFNRPQPSQATVPPGREIVAGTSDAGETATALRRAWANRQVAATHLDGKHSKGSLLAKDSMSDRVYLLKPGSGGQSPAAGAAEERASQSRREAAFWHVADDWGLGESVPRADLVVIDGHEYAAIVMLPFDWRCIEKKTQGNQSVARNAFAPYRERGLIHKWAVLDYVLGNTDRHADNLMMSDDNKTVALIDHGSAFAGPSFDPAYDQNSFVPFYLRAWAGKRFNNLSVREKLERMPTVSRQLHGDLLSWLHGLHADHLEGVLVRFGINPRPSVERLIKVKHAADMQPLDEAVNRLWVTT